MFADDKSIENFQQLFFEFKKYLELQKEYTKLELTEKLTILFSTLIMVLVLIILGMVALFYLLFALAYVLEPLVGGLMASSLKRCIYCIYVCKMKRRYLTAKA